MRHPDEAPALAAGQTRPRAMRGREGFFHAAQDEARRWWLLGPDGAAFFFRGVHGAHAAGPQGDRELPPDAAGRLRSWGFNALGVRGEMALRDDGLPFLAAVDFCEQGPSIVAPGIRLPDVFDPKWPELAAGRARDICPLLSECRQLVGWLTDDDLDWANPSGAGRPSLLQWCLSLEPAFAAYHAAWEFVLAHHGGKLEHLARAWNAHLPNKEVVRELTRAEEGLGTRGYLRDESRWAREFARRYFTVAASAIREADPNHLVFGCRFRRPPGSPVMAECAYPAIDVSMPHWTELPPPGSPITQPVLADSVCWMENEFLRAVTNRRTPRLTTLERILRKARTALDRLARHPSVVGYGWAQWLDQPAEQPPFARGLVHLNGTEAREHTELLTQFNLRAEALHRETDCGGAG